jgi:hypothetical protein
MNNTDRLLIKWLDDGLSDEEALDLEREISSPDQLKGKNERAALAAIEYVERRIVRSSSIDDLQSWLEALRSYSDSPNDIVRTRATIYRYFYDPDPALNDQLVLALSDNGVNQANVISLVKQLKSSDDVKRQAYGESIILDAIKNGADRRLFEE